MGFSIPTVTYKYVSIDHCWVGTRWAATDMLALKHRRLSVYPPEIPNGLLRAQSAICDVTKSPVWYDPSYIALFSIMLLDTVLVVLCCITRESYNLSCYNFSLCSAVQYHKLLMQKNISCVILNFSYFYKIILFLYCVYERGREIVSDYCDNSSVFIYQEWLMNM